MPKYAGYSAPFESRVQSRDRWRRVYMRVHVSRWLAYAVLLTAIALWGWREREPVWWYPLAVAVFAWLGLAGVMVLLAIRGWRSYVSTIMYMEALEDGLCKDRPFTWEGCGRWYREHGSPWWLQPVPESMRTHQGAEDWPML